MRRTGVSWLGSLLDLYRQALGQGVRGRVLDAALAATLLLLAIYGTAHGFDASRLLTGDTLYPVQMLDFSILDYRPPPPNRVFPDIGVHWLVSTIVTDPLVQKLSAGVILFVLVAALVGIFKGQRVFALVVMILVSQGFGFVDSACHYSLPLLVLLVQLSSRSKAGEALVLALAVFSDLLVLIPLAACLVDPASAQRRGVRAAAIALGLGAAAFYSDFGAAFLEMAVVLPFWIAALMIAQKYGLRYELGAAVCIGLWIGAAFGYLPDRYALPIIAGIAVALTPVIGPTFNWRHVAVPSMIGAIFLATVETSKAQRINGEFDCLADALAARDIANVAGDHWTTKPLYFAAKRRGIQLTLTQADFAERDSHIWMAPYSFAGAPTRWAVRSDRSCKTENDEPIFCAQASAAPVESRESLCNSFELFHYSTPIPLNYAGIPKGKLDAVSRHLRGYVAKTFSVLEARLEPFKLGSVPGRRELLP
ncbi:MAG: hypothetical protein WC807_16705 [Hyphomicrobium sp.]|jgi:hypothetical protein